MGSSKAERAATARGEPVRRRVLEAAERLLRAGDADFSMRDLAVEASVSFATPFNHFGSKAALMHALAERRIDAMIERFGQASPPPDALGRVLAAADIAVSVILAEPSVNRAVMGSIGTAGPEPGTALARARTLWTRALGDGVGLTPATRERALAVLPKLLAIGFRGLLSLWTAGELDDPALPPTAREMAGTLLLGYCEELKSTNRSGRAH